MTDNTIKITVNHEGAARRNLIKAESIIRNKLLKQFFYPLCGISLGHDFNYGKNNRNAQ